MFSVPKELLSIFFNHFSAFPVCCMPLYIFREQSIFYSPVLLCRCTYSVPTKFLHADRRWSVVSLWSLHYLHLSHSTNPRIFFHVLISIICSCNAKIDAVFLRSMLHFNHPESSSLYYLGVSLWSHSSAILCCLFLFCPSVKIFFSFLHPFFHSV